MTVIGLMPGQSPADWQADRGDLVWRQTFAGRPSEVSRARRFVRLLLDQSGREDDAALVVGELANNALQHSRSGGSSGWFGVEVTLTNGAVRIVVTDLGGGDVPALTHAPTLATGGRGLFLVAHLARAHGVAGGPEHGHSVWAELDVSGSRTL